MTKRRSTEERNLIFQMFRRLRNQADEQLNDFFQDKKNKIHADFRASKLYKDLIKARTAAHAIETKVPIIPITKQEKSLRAESFGYNLVDQSLPRWVGRELVSQRKKIEDQIEIFINRMEMKIILGNDLVFDIDKIQADFNALFISLLKDVK